MPIASPPQSGPRMALEFKSVSESSGERVLLYGTAKIGKTSLALHAPGPVVFFDLDRSLPKLQKSGMDMSDIRTLEPANYEELYAMLLADGWDGIQTIVIDSATVLEGWAEEDMLAKVPTEKRKKANSIEDYGWGKGYRHLYDRQDLILQALDIHVNAGRNTILICHDHVGKKPNVMGEDFLCYTPQLMETPQYSFKGRAKGWADHILFVSYDINVSDGKAEGSGTRTIYTKELPYLLAGSRTIKKPALIYTEGSTEVWDLMFAETPNAGASPKATTAVVKPKPITGKPITTAPATPAPTATASPNSQAPEVQNHNKENK